MDKMDKNNIPEEVTITPVIRDLEKLFGKILAFIILLFTGAFKSIGAFVAFCFKNFIKLSLIVFAGLIIGYCSIYVIPRNYASSMILEVNIDAKSQLQNDIAYFDALIDRNQFERLSTTLGISIEEAKSLKKFKISPYTTEYDKYKILDGFYRTLDTTTKRLISTSPTLIEEINGFSSKYIIQIVGRNEQIFQKLEPQLLGFLERIPNFVEERKNSKEILNFQRSMLVKQVNDLDTLKKVANKRLLLTSSQPRGISPNNNYNNLESKNIFNPLEIYDKSAAMYNELKNIDEKLSRLNKTYTVLSHFSEFGSKYGYGKLKRGVYLGLIFLGITFLYFALKTIVKESK